jgi:hypothetical protein
MDLSTITIMVVTIFSVGAAWGSLKRSVAGLEKTIDERITPELRDVSERLARIEERVTTLWERRLARAASPKKLTAYGGRLLRQSGIVAVIEKHEKELREEVLWKRPKNSHEAEVAITRALRAFLAHRPDISNTLEDRAYHAKRFPMISFLSEHSTFATVCFRSSDSTHKNPEPRNRDHEPQHATTAIPMSTWRNRNDDTSITAL